MEEAGKTSGEERGGRSKGDAKSLSKSSLSSSTYKMQINTCEAASNPYLEISPSFALFKDVKPSDQLSTVIRLRNKTLRMLRIRIIPPPFASVFEGRAGRSYSSLSRKKASESGQNAASSSTSSTQNGSLIKSNHSQILLKLKGIEIPINLQAHPPMPELGVPKNLSFKNVILDEEAHKTFTIRNTGMEPGTLKLSCDSDLVSLTPKTVEVKAKGQVEAKLILSSMKEGMFRAVVNVGFEGQSKEGIDLSWSVSIPRFEILLDGESLPLKHLDFGTLYYGQETAMKVRVINMSNQYCTFSSDVEEKSAENTTSDTIDTKKMESKVRKKPEIWISPSQSSIAPNSFTVLTCYFKPAEEAESMGFKHNVNMVREAQIFEKTFRFTSENLNLEKTISVAARACLPDVKISRDYLDFGECPVNSQQAICTSIQNRSVDLPLSFAFGKVAHFRVKPKSGTLRPLQSLQIEVLFKPNNMGKFRHQLPLTLAKGLRGMQLTLVGESEFAAPKATMVGGLGRTKKDFKRETHHVDPDVPVRLGKKKFSRKTGIQREDMQETLREIELRPDGLPRFMGYKESIGKQEHEYTYTLTEFQTREKNKHKYNKYLKEKRKDRAEKRKHSRTVNLNVGPYARTSTMRKRYFTETKRRNHGLKPTAKEEDMGMEFAEGLAEPLIALPEPEGKLVLPVAGLSSKVGQTGGPGKRFKPKPTTQAESRDCEMKLSQDELFAIETAPRVVRMGSVYCGVEAKNYFRVSNGVSHSIFVEIKFDAPELARSAPASQMIPPGETASFTVSFKSLEVCNFKHVVYFTINGYLTFNFLVTAEVVPLLINTRRNVEFEFSSANSDFFVVKELPLRNPTPIKTEFWFTLDSEVFSIAPMKGTIESNDTRNVKVTFFPKFALARCKHVATLFVKNGVKTVINLIGSLPEASCVLTPKLVDFGFICVGSSAEEVVHIKNQGGSTTVYKVDALPLGLRINPNVGVLPPGDNFPLKLALEPKTASELDTSVMLHLRGASENAKPFLFRVKAKMIIPDLRVVENEFNFDSVELGKKSVVPVTLENSSEVPVSVILNLADHKMFSLVFPPEWADLSPSPAALMQEDEINALMEREGMERKKKRGDADAASLDRNMYKLRLDRKSRMRVLLQFKPRKISTYMFELPMSIVGIPSYPSLRRAVSAKVLNSRIKFSPTVLEFKDRIVLERKGAQPYMKEVLLKNQESKSVRWKIYIGADFDGLEEEKDRSVKMLANLHKSCFHNRGIALSSRKDLDAAEAKHAGENPVVDNPKEEFAKRGFEKGVWGHDGDVIYKVNICEGVLEPNEEQKVIVFFTPFEAMTYNTNIQVVLNDEITPYIDIELTGRGSFPALLFSRDEIRLPVVPVGFSSDSTFDILNKGYKSLDIRYQLPEDSNRIPLHVIFPQGSTVTKTRDTCRTRISFSNSAPMSFTANVNFKDGGGNAFKLRVVGTADNCLLTNQAYLEKNKHKVAVEQHGATEPIKVYEKEKLKLAASGDGDDVLSPGRGDKVEHQADDEKSKAHADGWHQGSHNQRSASFAMRFMYAITRNPIFVTNQTVNFATYLAESGNGIFKCVNSLSGKRVFPKDSENGGNGSKVGGSSGEASSRLEKFKGFLNFLRSYGGMVDSVKAEHLLTKKFYGRILKHPTYVKEILGGDTKTRRELQLLVRSKEKDFDEKACEAWLTVLYQIMKIFILYRVTPKSFKALPGIPPEKTEMAQWMSKSNVYTVSENILLRWLNFHHSKLHPHDAKEFLVRFDKDLCDGRVLSDVLRSHVQSLDSGLDLDPNPKTDEAKLNNIKLLIETFKYCGLSIELMLSDFQKPIARDLMLLTLYLYLNLPSYMPKAVVTFACKLGESTKKTIELSNPSRKEIKYHARIDGSKDFQLQNTVVPLAPKGKRGSTLAFPIEFVSRFSQPSRATLTLTSEGKACTKVATMVFSLRSQITARQPMKIHEIEARVYEQKTITVSIKNPFPNRCSLLLSLEQTYEVERPELIGTEMKSKGGAGGAKGKKKKKRRNKDKKRHPPGATLEMRKIKHYDDHDSANQFVFWANKDKLRMEVGESFDVEVSFLPFTKGSYACELILFDKENGEFMYLIKGRAEDAMGHIDIKESGFYDPERDTVTTEVKLEHDNKALIQAKRDCVGAMESIPKRFLVGEDARNKRKWASDQSCNWGEDEVIYRVENESPYFILPIEVKLNPKDPTPISIQLLPRQPGVYRETVNLVSNKDIRVLNLEYKLKEKFATPTLEFEVAAGKALTQSIPIINNTDTPWHIKATLDAKNFKGADTMQVGPKSKGEYVLKFSPEWVAEVKGELQLVIQKGAGRESDTRTYNLLGIGKEPVAESKVVLRCAARSPVQHTFEVHNPTNSMIEFRVESDLPNISGESHLAVKPGKTGKYSLTIKPNMSGFVKGSITFVAPDGRFVWYVVELTVDSPDFEAELDINAMLRRAAQIEIAVANPLAQEITFEVELEGVGLYGEPFLKLAAHEQKEYPFVFAPLVSGTSEGAVRFFNSKIGEFWYKLKLTGVRPEPNVLPEFKCPIGKKQHQTVTIENPTDEDIYLNMHSSDPKHFGVESGGEDLLLVPAMQSKQFQVWHTASSIGERVSGDVILSNEEIGEWHYKCSGMGITPEFMDTIRIQAPVNTHETRIVTFVNPFSQPFHAVLSLAEKTQKNRAVAGTKNGRPRGFNLFLKKPKHTIRAKGSLGIPICFSPSEMGNYSAELIVNGGNDLVFKYPLLGITQGPVSSKIIEVKCQARKVATKVVTFDLIGLRFSDEKTDEKFSLELALSPEEGKDSWKKELVERCTSVELPAKVLKCPDNKLQVKIIFEPLRTVRAACDLMVHKKSGGCWKFKLNFVATDPDFDDTIQIEGKLGVKTSVAFGLNNMLDARRTKFSAFFTYNSAEEFSVKPKTGVLMPEGEDPTKFVIGFTPREYGKSFAGTLIIRTDLMQWTYLIKGTPPRYVRPVASSTIRGFFDGAGVGGTIQRKTSITRTKRNVVRENIRAVKGSPHYQGRNARLRHPNFE
eukprot:jgi/Bigna1/72093/fgenesh1_pg.18_\